MAKPFKVKMLDHYELEPTEGNLEEGIVSIYIEDWDLDLKNIPYYIDKEKKFHVWVNGMHLDRHQDGSVKEIFIPNFHFRNQKLWEGIKDAIQRTILKHLGVR